MPRSAPSFFVIGWTGPMMAIFPAPPRPFEVVDETHPDYAEAKGKGGDWEVVAGPFEQRRHAQRDADERREQEAKRHRSQGGVS